ncbi:MAG: hypothetical protein ACI8YC_001614 [Salibacteraceae bacterium]|jgi:hypothetical protein
MDGTSSMPAPVQNSAEESKVTDMGESMEAKDPNSLMN